MLASRPYLLPVSDLIHTPADITLPLPRTCSASPVQTAHNRHLLIVTENVVPQQTDSRDDRLVASEIAGASGTRLVYQSPGTRVCELPSISFLGCVALRHTAPVRAGSVSVLV